MAALTAPRHTVTRSGDIREPGVKGSTKIFQGAMAAVGADGFAVPASTATTLKILGRAEETVDNSAGADGAVNCRIATGIFRWDNSASGDAITRADIGATAYAVDDHTVAKTNGTNTRSAAGVIFDVDDKGVWIKH
ncbi:hypothetical protein [Hansschlegelia zhihuaiae]|uniref:DUF2190 family protein n=1 Tax=Hansschlegelia zhihuaiae TaxID=405005 RepID=A0A4Q0MNI0_9HYPH|nr:hypothetical protein [Hansschlegelia zhihuaiae]RXF75075.1 hypothetical protein EK403_03230 [Hansschlegelia zhihuaiae]